MRTNVAPNRTPITTHEGAQAVRTTATDQLRRSVMACMLFEGEFYEDGESIATRIHSEVTDILVRYPVNGPGIVANIAYEARTKFKLRHAPLWLIVALVRHNTKESREVVSGAIASCIQRPDELAELVSMYWKTKGDNDKKILTKQMKIGLREAFEKFDEWSLSRYVNRDGGVSMRDVMFLIHAKPKDGVKGRDKVWRKSILADNEFAQSALSPREELYQNIAENRLKAPEDTWESALSSGKDKKETFTTLLQEKKLGALALLRNLRNMTEAGVDKDLIRQGIRDMKTERVLPFRFITAARYAMWAEPELEAKMFDCLEGTERLSGKTAFLVDHSGSMQQPLSSKSEMTRWEAACALAILMREVCDEVDILAYSEAGVSVPPRRGFALRDALTHCMAWGGTNTQTAILAAAKRGYDRIVVFTDEQSHQTISNPFPGHKKSYFVNVASNQNGIGYRQWVHFDGMSEAVVQYIVEYEKQA